MACATNLSLRPAGSAAGGVPPLPSLERLALFLDLDGTLLDLALTPEEVVVPPGLADLLARLHRHLGGALAIVSGRTLASVLRLFPGASFPVAAEHGAVVRQPGGAEQRAIAPLVPAEWRSALQRLAATHQGVLLEEKPHGLVVHYRRAPEAGRELGNAVRALLTGDDRGFLLQPARMAWEIRPHGVDKGRAVASLLERPPFAGRVPVFVGDDTTDRDGMRAARAAGGFGLEVGPTFRDARGVRAWLHNLLDAASSPEHGA